MNPGKTRTGARRFPSALAALAVGAVAVTGCSVDGTPKAVQQTSTSGDATTASTSPSASGSASPLAGLKPCALFTEADVSANGLTNGTEERFAGDWMCIWTRRGDGKSGTAGVALRESKGISDLSLATFEQVPVDLGKYKGLTAFRTTNATVCTTLIEVSESSTVDVRITDSLATENSEICALSVTLAKSVSSRLP